MNIIKLQDQLKGLPDQILAGYVQNPTGEVPTYLALSELQRRKTMREKYEQDQAPTTTVAEDLVAPPPQEAQGLASIAPDQMPPEMMAQAPQMPQAPVEMAEGGLAELDVGDMYDEANFSSGGIVAFAKGGTPDDLGVIMPEVPTYDDIKMEQLNAFAQYGVDPEFYIKQANKLQEERDKIKSDKTQAGWMGLARAGFGMASGTSPFALKNIGEGAAQGIAQYGADIKDLRAEDRLLQQADMKLAEAQQAEARGDSRGAIKFMEDRKNLLLNAQLKEADIKKDIHVANAKLAAGVGKSAQDDKKREEAKRIAAAKIGEQKFLDTYPAGSASTVLGDDPGFIQFVRNLYIDDAYNFIDTKVSAPIPSENQMRKMYDNYLASQKNKTSGTKKTDTKSFSSTTNTKPKAPVDIKRPSVIDKIFNKHPDVSGSKSLIMNNANAAPNKRFITTNTEEELNTPWDRAGEGLDDEYYQ